MLELFETTQRVKIRLCPYTTCKSGTRIGCIFICDSNRYNKTKQVYFTPQIIKKQAFPRLFSFYFYCYLTHQPAPKKGEEKGDDAADDIGDAQPFLRNVRGLYPKCDGKYPRYCKQ